MSVTKVGKPETLPVEEATSYGQRVTLAVRTWRDGAPTAEVTVTEYTGNGRAFHCCRLTLTRHNREAYAARLQTWTAGKPTKGEEGIGGSVEHVSSTGLRGWARWATGDVGTGTAIAFERALQAVGYGGDGGGFRPETGPEWAGDVANWWDHSNG